METNVTTRVYPVGAVHMDDDTACSSPDTCGRTVYWPGGVPAELPTLAE